MGCFCYCRRLAAALAGSKGPNVPCCGNPSSSSLELLLCCSCICCIFLFGAVFPILGRTGPGNELPPAAALLVLGPSSLPASRLRLPFAALPLFFILHYLAVYSISGRRGPQTAAGKPASWEHLACVCPYGNAAEMNATECGGCCIYKP